MKMRSAGKLQSLNHGAEDHFSSIRILKTLPSHIISFTGNKELCILLRAEACSLLSITQASGGRLGHVLLWLFAQFFGY